MIAYAKAPDPFRTAPDDLAALQLAAIRERFAERRQQIRTLDRRAQEAGVDFTMKDIATVTQESTQSLRLRTGMTAIALVKSSSVIVATDLAGVRISTRNQLPGVVSSVTPGAVNSEVAIRLPGGTVISAVPPKLARSPSRLCPCRFASSKRSSESNSSNGGLVKQR